MDFFLQVSFSAGMGRLEVLARHNIAGTLHLNSVREGAAATTIFPPLMRSLFDFSKKITPPACVGVIFLEKSSHINSEGWSGLPTIVFSLTGPRQHFPTILPTLAASCSIFIGKTVGPK